MKYNQIKMQQMHETDDMSFITNLMSVTESFP